MNINALEIETKYNDRYLIDSDNSVIKSGDILRRIRDFQNLYIAEYFIYNDEFCLFLHSYNDTSHLVRVSGNGVALFYIKCDKKTLFDNEFSGCKHPLLARRIRNQSLRHDIYRDKTKTFKYSDTYDYFFMIKTLRCIEERIKWVFKYHTFSYIYVVDWYDKDVEKSCIFSVGVSIYVKPYKTSNYRSYIFKDKS